MKIRIPVFFLLMLAVSLFATAQDAIGPFISTVGTTVREAGNNRDWAYLLWTANNPSLLAGRAHAIYSKPGDANAVAPFARIAIVSLQSEAITLEPLLRRAQRLGEETNSLLMDIDALFGKFIPQNLTLPEKLSAVVRGGLAEEKHFGRMILLSRAHPSVAMALGFAHAELIPPGQTTFEVREFDRATQMDGAVVGRVTVTAGAPTVLPAPGAPVELKHDNARGHLNAQLRWGVPDELRRLSLLQHGYDVWRVRKDYADARNWANNPPTGEALARTASTAVKRVNTLPLLTSKTFTVTGAANFTIGLGDPTTFFIADDNDRGRSNILSSLDFTNGARFVYFVSARDILGRDGALSQGTEVQICNKLPPDAPTGVAIENDSVFQSGALRQRLRISWPQVPNLPIAEQQIRSYWIYRWKNVTDFRAQQNDPLANRIAIVSYAAGQPINGYLDDGPNAPTPPADLGKTFYYTIRAEDDGACHGNLSPHSAPVFGVLRDREGPPPPTGDIVGKCYEPLVRFLGITETGSSATPGFADTFEFSAGGVRGDARIAWIEFKIQVRSGSTNLPGAFTSGRLNFGSGFVGSIKSFPFTIGEEFVNKTLVVTASAGYVNGEFASSEQTRLLDPNLLKGDRRLNFLFSGDLVEMRKDVSCRSHTALGPNGDLQPIEVQLTPSAGSREVRVYRRIDDGPLDLIYQRAITNLNIIVFPDDGLPHGGGRVCYYASTLDEHGNASSLVSLGCRNTFETSALPRPQLSAITSLGDEQGPRMVLSWFCPGVNLDRFEVGIATFNEKISPSCALAYLQMIPENTNSPLESVPSFEAVQAGFPNLNINLEFRRFITPHPAEFGTGDRYTFPVAIKTDHRYIVYVKAIGLSGNRGERSNMESFIWQVAPGEMPLVPWPARPLPPVGNSFDLSFQASFRPYCDTTNLPGAATVQIAFKGVTDSVDCPQRLAPIYGNLDPNKLIPTNNYGESLLPVTLYRLQVTNGNFLAVSGDVAQVSPMMESIAWGSNNDRSYVLDPYVLVNNDLRVVGVSGGLYLRDTQPIIHGARYRYYLVRYNKFGEIAEVIPAANDLEVP